MSAEKDRIGFLLYLCHWDVLGELPPEAFKRVMQALFAAAGGTCEAPQDMDILERVAFNAVNSEVQRSIVNYHQRRQKRAEAGRKGGQKKAENAEMLSHSIDDANVPAESSNATDALAESSNAANTLAESSNATSALANPSNATNAPANSSNAANALANSSNATNALANSSNAKNVLANLAIDRDIDKGRDKAIDIDRDRGRDKNTIKPLSFVDAGPLRWAGTCAAAAAPEARVPLPSSTSGSGTPSGREVNAHFETLWALYPSKRGKNQVTAKAKRRLMQVDAAAMETAIARYVAEVEAAPYDRQWLNGSTWFNGRYQDYLGDDYAPKPVLSGARPSARSRETSYRSSEEERSRAARIAALEE